MIPFLAADDWRHRAACKGQHELFFASPSETAPARYAREAQAKAICRTCPVLVECRAYARAHNERGVWGGETEHDRASGAVVNEGDHR